MLLPLVLALVVKGLFRGLALVVFRRLMAGQQDGVIDAHKRRLLGALVLGDLAGSKLTYAIGYPDPDGRRCRSRPCVVSRVAGR